MINNEEQTKQNTNFAADSTNQNNQPSKTAAAPAADAGESKPENNSTAETIKSTAQGVLDKAKDLPGQAYGLAAEKATSTIEEQKTNLTNGLSGVAESIRQVGKNLSETDEKNAVTDLTAQYGEKIAGQIDNLSEYFDQKDLGEILRDVENFARRQPAIFIGAAFAVGLLTARFLKSSGDERPRLQAGQLTGRSSAAGNRKNQNNSNGQTAVNPS